MQTYKLIHKWKGKNHMEHQEYISKEQKQLRSKEIRKKRINKFLKNRLSVLGFIMTCLIVIACFICPILSKQTYDAVNIAESASAPSMEHIFGTDKLGRDLFIRCMAGGRYSIYIGVFSAVSSTVLGVKGIQGRNVRYCRRIWLW